MQREERKEKFYQASKLKYTIKRIDRSARNLRHKLTHTRDTDNLNLTTGATNGSEKFSDLE